MGIKIELSHLQILLCQICGTWPALRDVKATLSLCEHRQATSQILHPGPASCFHTLLKEQKQREHSGQGDSEQQDFPQAPFTANTKLQQHCLLARQLLNSPNAPASLTLVNLSPTHPASASCSQSGRSPEQDAEGLGKPTQNFDV